jgi:hypothetical protein
MSALGQSRPDRSTQTIVLIRFAPKADNQQIVSVESLCANKRHHALL